MIALFLLRAGDRRPKEHLTERLSSCAGTLTKNFVILSGASALPFRPQLLRSGGRAVEGSAVRGPGKLLPH